VGKILELEEVHRLFGNAFFFFGRKYFHQLWFCIVNVFFSFSFFFLGKI
jgi:hypothetical protein